MGRHEFRNAIFGLGLWMVADLHVIAHGWGEGGRFHFSTSLAGTVFLFLGLLYAVFGDREKEA
jgi:hypothetical protein